VALEAKENSQMAQGLGCMYNKLVVLYVLFETCEPGFKLLQKQSI
jgi:hypothetical protein